jgi:hypothetical protein
MGADSEMIARQPKGTFAAFIRGVTERVVPISFPFFVLEKSLKTTTEERDEIRAYSRKTYAHEWQSPKGKADSEDPSGEPPSEEPKNSGDDPLSPSTEL